MTSLDNLSKQLGGARIYAKREDLNQTGAHKINNVIGQRLAGEAYGLNPVSLLKRGLGSTAMRLRRWPRVLAWNAKFIWVRSMWLANARMYFGWRNWERRWSPSKMDNRRLKMRSTNVYVIGVTNMDDTHYVLGTACGPHPFPEMVSWFQSIIGEEAREQFQTISGGLPDRVYACVGGGSNAIGLFQGFLGDSPGNNADNNNVELVGCEAGGFGPGKGNHAARLAYKDASVGVAQGYKTYFLQNDDGNMLPHPFGSRGARLHWR